MRCLPAAATVAILYSWYTQFSKLIRFSQIMNFVTLISPHIHKSHDYYAKIMALKSTNSVALYYTPTPSPSPQAWDP
jgi:hypothetical protein